MKVPSLCKCPLMHEATTNSYSPQASLWHYPSLVILYDKPILNKIVSIVGAFRFQGSTISQDLRWTWNTASITKRHNKRCTSFVSSGSALLIHFHTGIIQSVLCTSIIVWFRSATQQDKSRLQRTIKDCWENHWCYLHSIQDVQTSKLRKL